jgi:hypothetical protein
LPAGDACALSFDDTLERPWQHTKAQSLRSARVLLPYQLVIPNFADFTASLRKPGDNLAIPTDTLFTHFCFK